MSSSSKSTSKRASSNRLEQGDEGETSFLALVLGMITTLLIVFGIFGVGDNGKAEEARKRIAEKDRIARMSEAKKNADANQLVSAINDDGDKTEKFKVETASMEELLDELLRLRDIAGRTFKEKARFAEAQVAVGKEILRKNPTGEVRQLVVCDLIKAVTKLYGIDFSSRLKIPNVDARFREVYEPYLEDTDQSIYRASRLALVTHQSFDHLKSGANTETESLAGIFAETITRFPDDKHVASMIEFHFDALSLIDPVFCERLFNDVERKFLETENPTAIVRRLFQNLRDKFLLREVDYISKYENRWVYGSAGRRELVKVSLDLLKKDNLGMLLMGRVDQVASWLERHGHEEDANKVYGAMLEAAEKNVVAESRQFALKMASGGIQRGSLLGRPFVFEGVDSAGTPLNPKDFKEKSVLVIFWSASNIESVKFLKEFDKNAYDLTTKAIRVLAVCVDEETNRELGFFKRRAPCIRIVEHRDADGQINSIYQQCPPSILPHTLLVGYNGKVADVNVKPEQAKNEALSLLLNRND
jgi:hypothetical protein